MGVRIELPILPIGEAALVDIIVERLPKWSSMADWDALEPELQPLHMLAYWDPELGTSAPCFLSVNEVQPGSVLCRLLVGGRAADAAEELLVLLAFLFPVNRELIQFWIEYIREHLKALVWDEDDRMSGLSERDRQILNLWREGYTAAEIGDDPGVALSPGTVRNVVWKLRSLLGVDNVPFHRN